MQTENKITSQVNSFGGISFVMAKMRQLGIADLFDTMLGYRVPQARYSYSDVFLGWMYCNLCGAKRIEDIYTENLQGTFRTIPIANLCSPDSLARIFKRFATPTDKHVNKDSGKEHEFNNNQLLNDLLLQFSKELGLVNETDPYLIDYDATIVPVEKLDAKKTYKEILGYSPAVSFIGKTLVNIEGRNGNTPASYKVKESLQAMYVRLAAHNIKTWGIRMDAASYQKDVLDLLIELKQKFYIRVSNTAESLDDFKIASWKEIDFHNYIKEEIGSVEFYPFKGKQAFRFVITRRPVTSPEERKDGKTHFYRGIITNDMETEIGPDGLRRYVRSDVDVVKLYDQRGDAENNFRDLLHDFNWKRVPFSYMNENLVFMYVSAMAKTLFDYLMREFSEHTKALKNKFKLKKFVAYFVRRVSVLWSLNGESWSFELLNLKEKFEALQSWAIRK